MAIWGYWFYYWVIHVLGNHEVAPVRSLFHLVLVSPFVAAGCFGGFVILRRRWQPPLVGAWLVWLALILIETWTSGVAWMLNHIGPGSLIGGIWLMAGLVMVFRSSDVNNAGPLKLAAAAALVLALFGGMGLIRRPVPMLPPETGDYAAAIEREFSGYARDRVLLDAGTWVYLPEGIVMKDRAPTVGERGWSQTGDFSGIVNRIELQRYDKILLRSYDSGELWYDHETWQKSSGIRAALAENYHVVCTYPAVTRADGVPITYLFGPLTVLKAKSRPNAASLAKPAAGCGNTTDVTP
jgi:hypothetical protein